MQIEQGIYGDFKVSDELAFNLDDLEKAKSNIYWSYGVFVASWPIVIEHNTKTGYWEVYFLNPAVEEVEND